MTPGTQPLVPRFAVGEIQAALGDTPVVLVVGPRQCGKTTLVRRLLNERRAYLTLDDDTTLEAARGDPVGFVRGLDRVTIDEIQRVPELLRAIKLSVDDDRRPGRFLLTGSANVLALPQLSEALVGRMAVVELFPLSRAELAGARPSFLTSVLGGRAPDPAELVVGDGLIDVVLTGGFPEMLARPEPERRSAWARDYLNAIVRRDALDIADVEHQDRMRRMCQVLALHSGQLTNFARLGGRVGIDDKTARRYLGILEHLYLVRRLPPWFRNRLKRLVKTPKLHFLDSGILAATLGTSADRIRADRGPLGPLLESFVFGEILRQASWLGAPSALFHYRDKDQDEVDIVVEGGDGGVVGLEVKASATVRSGDFGGIRKLAAAAGPDFRIGIVLYDGDRLVPFGGGTYAVPISCLWG